MSVSGYLQVYENHGQDSRYKPIETSPTISAKAGTGGNNLPLVVHGGVPDVAPTLMSCGNKTGRADPLNGVLVPVYSDGIPDLANTLTARMAKGINTTLDEGQTPIVCFSQNQVGDVNTGDIVGTLNTNSNASGRNTPMVSSVLGVRRLMPVECERLMGFPDGLTFVPWRKGMAPDGPRYRAIGNSKARPICEWIARRIQKQIAKQP